MTKDSATPEDNIVVSVTPINLTSFAMTNKSLNIVTEALRRVNWFKVKPIHLTDFFERFKCALIEIDHTFLCIDNDTFRFLNTKPIIYPPFIKIKLINKKAWGNKKYAIIFKIASIADATALDNTTITYVFPALIEEADSNMNGLEIKIGHKPICVFHRNASLI